MIFFEDLEARDGIEGSSFSYSDTSKRSPAPNSKIIEVIPCGGVFAAKGVRAEYLHKVREKRWLNVVTHYRNEVYACSTSKKSGSFPVDF